ncbi:MAG: sugar ABC transporter permease [Propionibacteriaceae bacterium]|jgi:putative multiple sugar transport system permease protein|nr:sugar ABC transporter permease [Propionibacteriaceae bacterium]
MKHVSQIFGGNLRQYGMVGALVLLVIFFQWQTAGKMITPTNFQNLLNGNSYVLIIAIGMLFVIVTGQIDLAPGSVAAVVGICVAMSIQKGDAWWWVGVPVGVVVALGVGVGLARTYRRKRQAGLGSTIAVGVGTAIVLGGAVGVGVCLLIAAFGIPWWGGVLIGLGAGALIGAWQGAWLAYIGVPGFITTLAGQMLFRGVYRWIGKAQSIPVPKPIQYIGGGYLPEWGPSTGLNNSTLLLGIVAIVVIAVLEFRRRGKLVRAGMAVPHLWVAVVRLVLLAVVIGGLTYLYGSGPVGTSFPVTGCILTVFILVYNFLATRTTLGRGVYAVGGNRIAAGLTGINTKKIYFLAMANVSFLAGVAAVMYVGRARSTGPSDGTGWELDAIAAVFIGGAAVSGGVGTVFGVLVGGLVMAALNNGLYLMGVSSDLMSIIKGLVLLVAVAFDLYSKAQGRPSIIGSLQRGLKRGKPEPATSLVHAPSVAPAVAPAVAHDTGTPGSSDFDDAAPADVIENAPPGAAK